MAETSVAANPENASPESATSTPSNDALAASELETMLAAGVEDAAETAPEGEDLETDAQKDDEPEVEKQPADKSNGVPALTDAEVSDYLAAAVAPDEADKPKPAAETPKPKRSAAARAKLDALKSKIGELDSDAIMEAFGEVLNTLDADEPSAPAAKADAKPANQKPTPAQMQVLRVQLHTYIDGMLPQYKTTDAKDQLIQVAEMVALGAARKGKPIGDSAAFLAAHNMLERIRGEGAKATAAKSAPKATVQHTKSTAAKPARKRSNDEEAADELSKMLRTPLKN